MWGAIAYAGLSVASGLKRGLDQNAQLQSIQNENERQNSQTWRAMGERINTVNLQRGLLRQQTGTDLYTIGKEANRAAGASVNNAAASGIEGVSVDEAVSDIQRQNVETQAQTKFNEQIQEMNLDTQIQDIINAAVADQRYSQEKKSTTSVIGDALFQGGMSFATTYAASAFQYGASSGLSSSASSLGSTNLTTDWVAKAGQFNPVPSQYSGSFFGG